MSSGINTLMGRVYDVSTSVGKFSVPSEVIKEGFIDDIFSLADQCIRDHYEPKEFIESLHEKYPEVSANATTLMKTLYESLLKLELKGINRIWTRVLKNAFAPNFEGRFHYVVGNPPWTGWETLPEDYRKSTEVLWKEHGLLTKTEGIGLGKIKKDLSMLFLVRSVERYLNDTGKLAFLMTFTVFKMQSAAGFRNYLANKCEVIKLHDLVELRPFDAINRTSLIVVDKGRTKFPIAAVSWTKAKGGEIPQDASLSDVLRTYSKKQSVVARPVGSSPESPWLIVSPKILKAATNFFGSSTYKAKAGVVTMLNGAYWLRVLSKEPGGLLIENLGDISWKKKVKIEQAVIESDLIYLLLRGQEVKRWSFDPGNYILMPSLPNGDDIDDSTMKVRYPKTYSFLNKFFDEFIERAGEPYKTNLAPYKKQGRKARNIEHPFYYLFNANGQFEKYKVVWKHVSGSISGKAEFNAAVVTQIRDKFIGTKPTILDHGLMFVNCSSKEEAHYIAAILNSTVFREVVRGYSLETHVTTDIFDYLRLPEFEKRNKLHLRLAAKSEAAHRLTEEGKEKQVQKIEEEIDEMVEQLFE